ncbi:MAG: sugar phosphate isomerase/epimerase [Anaerolineae bacterium]
MRLGISSWTYSWAIGVPGHPPEHPLDALALLDKATSLDVHVVQIADNLPLDRLSPAALDTLERRAAELDVQIEVGTRGIGHDNLRTYLQLAQRLKSPILRVVIDTADHHPDQDEVVVILKEIIPEFERAGVCLAIENHDRFKARSLAQIVERIGSRYVGICLDTVNSFGALEGPEAVLEALGPLVVNLHVKDFTIFRANHSMGFTIEGRPAGQGRLNVPWLLEKLATFGLEVNAILELWTPPEATLPATIEKEDAWAITSIRYLRTLIPD